ncbi:MAG: hypothetical protein WA989_09700 [Henriciella sp.]|uniref:hypothetical protein n=1 Tax=Henriciella sp. TaxID=1968823 RepID=UPI003C71DDF6
MAQWIIPVIALFVFLGLIVQANRKMGGVRKDGRPNQVPWGLVMVFCALGIFVTMVHMINLAGFETGPEHSLMGRFGG